AEDGIRDFHVTGVQTCALPISTGNASALVARAWLSATVIGPDPGWIHCWFQSDFGGIADAERVIGFKDGRSERPWVELPNGTTTINIHYRMPQGGCLTLEMQGK